MPRTGRHFIVADIDVPYGMNTDTLTAEIRAWFDSLGIRIEHIDVWSAATEQGSATATLPPREHVKDDTCVLCDDDPTGLEHEH